MNNAERFHRESTPIAEGLSKEYAPVNTDILLAPFLNKGWCIKRRIRPSLNKQGLRIGKELVTLTHPDYFYDNGDHMTVEVMNGNTGTNALLIMGGYGRIACSNGLIIGDIEGGRFVHRGRSIYDRLEEQYDRIIAHLDGIKSRIDKLKSTTITDEQVDEAIDKIVAKLFNKSTKKRIVRAEATEWSKKVLKRIRRQDDSGLDAFTRMNVVQERIIRNGQLGYRYHETDVLTGEQFNEIRTKRGNEGKLSSIATNKIITEAFLEVIA